VTQSAQPFEDPPHAVLGVLEHAFGEVLQHSGSLAPMNRRNLIVGAICLLIPALLFQPHRVQDEAMMPSIKPGEWVVLGPVLGLQKGDVVVVEDPADPGRDVMRRVVGILGEESLVVRAGLPDGARHREMGRGDHLIVLNEDDGWLVRTRNREFHEPEAAIEGPGLVLLADDRDGPTDSRLWGAVPIDAPSRRVWLRIGGPDDAWRSAISWRAQDGPWIPPSRQPAAAP
jgi:signal peptidase I